VAGQSLFSVFARRDANPMPDLTTPDRTPRIRWQAVRASDLESLAVSAEADIWREIALAAIAQLHEMTVQNRQLQARMRELLGSLAKDAKRSAA
jgi:hypothetical protein